MNVMARMGHQCRGTTCTRGRPQGSTDSPIRTRYRPCDLDLIPEIHASETTATSRKPPNGRYHRVTGITVQSDIASLMSRREEHHRSKSTSAFPGKPFDGSRDAGGHRSEYIRASISWSPPRINMATPTMLRRPPSCAAHGRRIELKRQVKCVRLLGIRAERGKLDQQKPTFGRHTRIPLPVSRNQLGKEGTMSAREPGGWGCAFGSA